MTGGLNDWTGLFPLKVHGHVKIRHPRHQAFGQTGTIVRLDREKRKVWVALPDGRVVPAGHRSVEVLVPRPQRKVK